MLIQLTDFFRGKKPGDIIDWPDPMAQILIDNKRAVPAGDPVENKAVDSAPVDKMQRRASRKK